MEQQNSSIAPHRSERGSQRFVPGRAVDVEDGRCSAVYSLDAELITVT